MQRPIVLLLALLMPPAGGNLQLRLSKPSLGPYPNILDGADATPFHALTLQRLRALRRPLCGAPPPMRCPWAAPPPLMALATIKASAWTAAC